MTGAGVCESAGVSAPPGARAESLAARRRHLRRRFAIAVVAAVAATGSAVAIARPWLGERTPAAPSAAAPGVSGTARADDERVAVAGISATQAPTTATPTSATPTSASVARPQRFTIAVTGDILLHSPVSNRAAAFAAERGTERGTQAYDYTPMFDRVRPILGAADLALCHLETPLSPDDRNITTYPSFSVPWEIAPAIAGAGFDGCSTASNHSFDRGTPGVDATLAHLDAAGLAHAGSARTAAEAAIPTLHDAAGARVAHLAYTTFVNGARPREQWELAFAEPERIAGDAARARAAGADFVVVSVHWGNEFVRDPTARQEELADAITAIDDVDLVVGHHAHVVQPIELRNGTWVVWGLGNFLSNQHETNCCPAASQDGIIVRITVEAARTGDAAAAGPRAAPWVVSAIDYTPTWVDRSTFTIVAVDAALADPATPDSLRGALTRSRERTAEAVRSRGASIPESPRT